MPPKSPDREPISKSFAQSEKVILAYLKHSTSVPAFELRKAIDTVTDQMESNFVEVIVLMSKIAAHLPRIDENSDIFPPESFESLYVFEAAARRMDILSARIEGADSGLRSLALDFLHEMFHRQTWESDYPIVEAGTQLLIKHRKKVIAGIRSGNIECLDLMGDYYSFDPEGFKLIDHVLDKIFKSGDFDRQFFTIQRMLRSKSLRFQAQEREIEMVSQVISKELARELIYAWAASDAYRSTVTFRRNIFHVFELEEEEPGSVEYLMQNFNIRCFGRYPKELLLQQYRDREDSKSPYGLVIFPYSDSNGSFYEKVEVLQSFADQLDSISRDEKSSFNIRIFEC